MNTGNLKSYAPQARKDFIAAVTARANLLGLSEVKGTLQVAPAEVKNDIVMIAGRPWPVKVNEQRTKLIARMKLQGFGHTVEAVAYVWFNRLAALRYMEVHDYLGHGRRVLSNPQGGLPEVQAHALDLAESNALPGLSADTVRELKLANEDPQLYRLILIAQCNALHQAMPFLFEQLGDETELLLPENLLLTDSVVAKLVQSIPEEDWQQIEIIGWLYQFYISEKKDQVIGKVVKSEDIPAATQLFTPNWIVKYMVQNSLGAQWLATYPDSTLKAQMEYYIEPAVQTDEVNAQLAAITPTSLNPEELTLIDPASGSGHILVEAYDLFKAIYLERGYRQRDVAKLILEKNLFGLDIDERAAQLTGFALMMKARADDRQLFERGVKLNVMALTDGAGFDPERLAQGVKLDEYGLELGDLTALKELFEHAMTFGSLIQVPEELVAKLQALKQLSETTGLDLFVSESLNRLSPIVRQAELLAAQYDAVVANPPYMGSKYHVSALKNFMKDHYVDAKSDLFSAFVIRCSVMGHPNARVGMMSPNVWMYISSHEGLRQFISSKTTLASLIELPLSGFKGATVQICSFTFSNVHVSNAKGSFIRLVEFKGGDTEMAAYTIKAIRDHNCGWFFETAQDAFKKIPGSPVAYWVSERTREVFISAKSLSEIAEIKQGLATCNNALFVRHWCEVSYDSISFGAKSPNLALESEAKWFPYNKGGGYRKWFGNNLSVVNWQHGGRAIHEYSDLPMTHLGAPVRAKPYYFRPGITYGLISSFGFSSRKVEPGFVFDVGGSMVFPDINPDALLGFLCSKLAGRFIDTLNPTLNYQVGDVARLPILEKAFATISQDLLRLISLAKSDENAYELAWGFQSPPILKAPVVPHVTLESSFAACVTQTRNIIAEVKRLEEENNRFFIDAYGLQDELTPDVPIEQITLTVNPAYRYGGKLTEEELWARFRQDTMAELISYAIGCMMGRYSLDAPGLIYANSGNVGFDGSRYTNFPADADGIVPVTDELWFEDDAALRVREFLLAVWGKESLEQNMAFLADNLGRKASESPEQAIRRYLADKFFKDHLQTYKKRPIYWLFSSGKQGAFQALVYLHRYNASTLSRLRAEYVVPLTGKMQTKIEQLQQDVAASSSTAQRNKLTKLLEKLRKQHLELLAYDEQLRHYADQRITLDLDDGVKVNYGKFGDLLAEVKAVTGGKGDDE